VEFNYFIIVSLQKLNKQQNKNNKIGGSMFRTSTRLLSVVVLFLIMGIHYTFGQGLTTAEISGTIYDNDGNPLMGATVIALHTPSGTTYGANSRSDGKYNITGLRVGGPYTVTVSLVGYTTEKKEGVFLSLGQNLKIDFTSPQSTIELKGVTVTAEKNAILSGGRTGAETSVSTEAIEDLPTIRRRIEDVSRVTPQYGNNYSFGGVDNRFNNLTIDGSYFNNSFGLAGQPGDRTGVAPVSLDAIEQVQVSLAPYDVRLGNFIGAGINAVTKSGTNEYTGSVYYDWRTSGLVGTEAKGNVVSPGTFTYDMVGARLSGPIIKDNLFFFLSYEKDKQVLPGTTYLANTGGQPVGGQVTRVLASDLDALSSFLSSKFGYSTGPYEGYNSEIPSDRFLAKFDYNINDKNKISLRYTQLDSKTDVLLSNSSSLGFGSRRSNLTGLNFQNSNYQIMENIRSWITEFNSVLSPTMTNNFILGYTYNDESRASRGTFFPFVDVLNSGSVYTSFGFEPFTPDNILKYHTIQIQDNFQWYQDNHVFSFGATAEQYESDNGFYPGIQSIYVYNSLSDFYADANGYLANPNRTTSPVTLAHFQVRYNNIPGQVSPPLQPLKVWYTGLYAQDEWQVIRNLKLTGGLRIDVPFFTNTAFNNSRADSLIFRDEKGNPVTYNTGKLPNANILWSPRLGFNWDYFGDRTTQIRGGSGIFTAPPAFVWISNQIGNTGVLTGLIDVKNTTAYPFNPDPNHYKPAPTGAIPASYELATTDPNFKFPQTWRSNIAVDQSLPFGIVGTVEGLYSRDVNGIYYINANLPAAQTSFTGVDNRPRWTSNRINPSVTDNTVIKNENIGYNWSVSAVLEKPFGDGLFYKVGYNFGVAKNTIDPGSIAYGSWTANAIALDPNNPGVSYSSYSPGHRVFASVSYRADYLDMGATTVSLFWDYSTPTPSSNNFSPRASYTFSGDLNGDGATGNDLIYIPRNQSEMNFVPYSTTISGVTYNYTVQQQKDAWDAYINQDPYLSKNRGHYAERNGLVFPLVARLDLSIMQEVYANFLGKKNSLQFRADVLNIGNLINHSWGVSQSLLSGGQPLVVATAAQGGPADALGRPQYTLKQVGGKLIDHTFIDNVDPSSDVYRIQFSLRYLFN
jgi:outer membrane receptor protein involved in Fe transport